MPETLQEQLLTLALYVRDPKQPAPSGVEASRLAVYRQLFIGNLNSLLGGSFPVIRATLGDARWRVLIHAFYADYRCQTPLFSELARELVVYLEEGAGDALGLPPWLAELAHYEWTESALLLSASCEPAHKPEGDLLEGVPLLSTLAWPLAYCWPVCDIGPNHLPPTAPNEPTLILVQRRADHRVHFSRLAPLAYALLASLQTREVSGREHLASLAEAVGASLDQILPQGQVLLESLRVQGVLLGSRA